MTGLLVLVIGPSGSGKDTLMAGAAVALAQDDRFRFARRVVTRPEATEEDHEVVDAEGFAARRDAGGFALHWEAHDLHYGIPADIVDDLAAGRAVVANVSRSVLAAASARFPTLVVEITVPDWVRAVRLRRRGRETPEAVTARMTREVPFPEGLPVFTIVNDGTIADGVAALANFLLTVTADVGASDDGGRGGLRAASREHANDQDTAPSRHRSAHSGRTRHVGDNGRGKCAPRDHPRSGRAHRRAPAADRQGRNVSDSMDK